MKPIRTLLALCLQLAPLSLAISVPLAHAASSKAPEVTLDEFKKMVTSKSATIIDANSADMYKDGHVPGAISFAKNEGKLAQVLPADKAAPIVAYCGGPKCTAWESAAAEAEKLGYTNVKHYKGGIKVWKDSGEKLEKMN